MSLVWYGSFVIVFHVLYFADDTCVTLAEYLSVHSCPVASTLYAHYDHDSDGCLNTADMSQEFHMIDHSRKLTMFRCYLFGMNRNCSALLVIHRQSFPYVYDSI
jgi:hypothetical protein